MKNYTQFASNFLKYLEARNLDLPDLIGKPNLAFESNITHGLLKCHIFEVMDDVKRLLALTKTPKINDMVKLPFPVIFIDVNFKRKEMDALGIDIGFDEIQGIIVQDGKIYFKEKDVDVGTSLRLSISALDYGEAHIFETYAENKNFYDEYKPLENKIEYVEDEGLNHEARRFIKMFVMNFLNFINSPDVSFIGVKYSEERNDKRIKDGKLPIPSRTVIKLNGVLRKYVEEIKRNPIWSYNYRFFVRGHFRTLRAERYGENIGKRLWIPPYIKGKGVLIEKEYVVDKQSEAVDEV